MEQCGNVEAQLNLAFIDILCDSARYQIQSVYKIYITK